MDNVKHMVFFIKKLNKLMLLSFVFWGEGEMRCEMYSQQ